MAPEPDPIVNCLERLREQLLDLTSRNRLLSTPRRKARTTCLEIICDDVHALVTSLVRDGKSYALRSRSDETSARANLFPSSEHSEVPERAGAHSPDILRVDRPAVEFEKRLLRL